MSFAAAVKRPPLFTFPLDFLRIWVKILTNAENGSSSYSDAYREGPVGARLWLKDFEPVREQQEGKPVFGNS